MMQFELKFNSECACAECSAFKRDLIELVQNFATDRARKNGAELRTQENDGPLVKVVDRQTDLH